MWQLAWRRIIFLRPGILKLFGATLLLKCLISGCVRIHFPWSLTVVKHVALGLRGRQWMQAEFPWEKVGAMMDKTYLWLAHGGEPPPWVRME